MGCSVGRTIAPALHAICIHVIDVGLLLDVLSLLLVHSPSGSVRHVISLSVGAIVSSSSWFVLSSLTDCDSVSHVLLFSNPDGIVSSKVDGELREVRRWIHVPSGFASFVLAATVFPRLVSRRPIVIWHLPSPGVLGLTGVAAIALGGIDERLLVLDEADLDVGVVHLSRVGHAEAWRVAG